MGLVEIAVSRTSGPRFVVDVGKARAAVAAGDTAMLTRHHHPVAFVDAEGIHPATLPHFDPPGWVTAAARILARTTR